MPGTPDTIKNDEATILNALKLAIASRPDLGTSAWGTLRDQYTA